MYFTPWKTSIDMSWKAGFNSPPPRHEHTDLEYNQVVANWLADRKKFEKKADTIIWGSLLEHPDIAVSPWSGKPIVFDDSGVIARIRGANMPDGKSEKIARRIVDCVNAFQGIEDPVGFMKDVRALLADLEKEGRNVERFIQDDQERPKPRR